jgi:catechol O-methyltransferase
MLEQLTEVGGRRMPFMRWSFVRLIFGMKNLLKEWQVGDGREQAVLDHVLATAPAGDIDAAIAAIDDYAYRQKYLINLGDEKGAILDAVLDRSKPMRVLELGAYIGYSALRFARKLPPGGRLYSVEFSEANAAITRRMLEHAGASDRVTVVHGTLGDGGKTLAALREQHGFAPGNLDLVFIDHDKEVYVPDLERILAAGFLHPGSVVVADNIAFPGAPKYRGYMKAAEGRTFRSESHKTHAEYQTLIPDVVMVSTFIG